MCTNLAVVFLSFEMHGSYASVMLAEVDSRSRGCFYLDLAHSLHSFVGAVMAAL
jgi:hypothetical protein